MKYKIFGKEITGPFTIPSGIVATETSVLERIAKEIPEIGILTTKSIGLEPSEGNREPIIAQYNSFSFINAVGLTNPGAKEFAKRISKIKIPENKFLLTSIFGKDEKEFKKIAQILFNHTDGFELNISCPHSKKYGQVVGQNPHLVEKITKNVASLGKPVFIKISPNLNIKETVKVALKSGVSGITAINTKGPEPYFFDNYSVLSNKLGGISGKTILELGIKTVKEVRKMTNLPIIACGGISTAKDVKNYKMGGANFFGIGSALVGMSTQEIKQYFYSLTAPAHPVPLKEKLNMEYQKYRVRERRILTEDLFLLRLDRKIKINPGQFIFAWLPGKGEKPFSILDDNPLTLLIQKKGCFTKELAGLKENDSIYIRGPYGNFPKIEGKILLVGGGTGVAAIYLFAKRNKNTISLLGAKDKNHLPYLEEFENASRLYLTTESGEIGDKGLITDKLKEIIKKEKPDYCLNCGPELMVKKAIQIEKKFLSQEKIYSSIDFITKCGIGLCGSCATSKGFRSCVDGPFLESSRI